MSAQDQSARSASRGVQRRPSSVVSCAVQIHGRFVSATHIAALKGAPVPAAEHGRRLVWWQMSAVASSTRRGSCADVTPRAARARRRCRSAALSVRNRARTPRRRRQEATRAPARRTCRHRLGVPRGDGVDHHRWRAVVHVAHRAEGVGARCTTQVLLERDRAHHRRPHHVAARAAGCPLLGHRGGSARAAMRVPSRGAMPSHSGW